MKVSKSQILVGVGSFVLILALCSLAVYLTLYFYPTSLEDDIREELSKNIGDFITGTIGILLAFISTIFLFVTFWFQRKQFSESHKDAYKSRFEGTFFNMLSMLYQVREESNNYIKAFSSQHSDGIKGFYEDLRVYYDNQIKINEGFSQTMKLAGKTPLRGTEWETVFYNLSDFYDKYVILQKCNPGFFFRYIHNLITFVIYHWEKYPDEIHTYLNFIQAQMTDMELVLLFYDSMSSRGMDKNKHFTFKDNLDKYSFLENIPEHVLLERNHYKMFPKTKFSFLNADERKNLIKQMSK